MKLSMAQTVKHIPHTSAHDTRNAHTRSLWQRCLVLLTIALTFIGAGAQTPTTHADGVYKIYWESDNRGYLTYHADYPTQPQLAGVTLEDYGSEHYDLAADSINLGWYLYTSPKTKKSYLFEATTGKFLAIDLTQEPHDDKACVLTDEVSEYAQFDLYATTNVAGFLLRYVDGSTNYQLCSACGTSKGDNPVRFVTGGQEDGGVPFVFVSRDVTIADDVRDAAIAKVTAYELYPEDGKAYTLVNVMGDDDKTLRYMHYHNGDKVTVSTNPADASTFICVKLKETVDDQGVRKGVYAFVTEDGHFLTWIGNKEENAYKENDVILGYSSTFPASYDGLSDWNEITIYPNWTTSQETEFNHMRMVARRNKDKVSSIIVHSSNRFDEANEGYWFGAEFSSAWIFTEQPDYEVPKAQSDAVYAVRAQTADANKTILGGLVYVIYNKAYSTRNLNPVSVEESSQLQIVETPYSYWRLVERGKYHSIELVGSTYSLVQNNNETGAGAIILGEYTDENDRFLFELEKLEDGEKGGIYAIKPKNSSGNSFNPFGGVTGMIGLYDTGDDASRWMFEHASVPTPSLTFTDGKLEISKPDIPGVIIYYTMDGTTPNTSSAVYDDNNRPVVTGNIVKILAHCDGFIASTKELQGPVSLTASNLISLTKGNTQTISCTLKGEVEGIEIYRELTFTVADPNIATVDDNGKVTAVAVGNTTVTVTAKKINGEEILATTHVLVTPKEPTLVYNDGKVTITTDEDNAIIYYTTDGSDPTRASNVYSGPIDVDGSSIKQVKAFVLKSKMESAVSAWNGDISAGNVYVMYNRSFPLKNLHPKEVEESSALHLESNTTSLTYWKLVDKGDGYYGIALVGTDYSLKYVNANAGGIQLHQNANEDAFKYTLTKKGETTKGGAYAVIPKGRSDSFNPHGGEWGDIALWSADDKNSQWVFEHAVLPEPEYNLDAITCELELTHHLPNVTYYYSINGDEPTTDSPLVYDDNKRPVLKDGDVVRVLAVCEGFIPSRMEITADLTVTTPTITINTDTKKTTIASATSDVTIYYTIDGSTPNESSNKYVEAFDIASGTVVKAIAMKEGYKPSEVVSAYYNDATAIEGDGTEGNPFQIKSQETLAAFGNYVKANPGVTYHAKVVASFSGYNTPIEGFVGVFDGDHYTISGLCAPLFSSANNATIKNVVLDEVSIFTTGNVGAIVGTASGATRIYNCGVLGGTIGGKDNVGGIAGKLNDEARVINCYSFANITGGNTVGGIVGYNSEASTSGNLKTLVVSCMFYGDITGGTNIYPIYGGKKITNVGDNGINNYNYFRQEAKITPTGDYNCALAAEERYLTRFEFYRHALNSQRKLNAFYVTGNVENYEEIAKWVLDVDVAPYPILKQWGKYESTINKKVKSDKILETLAVTITGHSEVVHLPITDIDPEAHDYNYYKVQLPYYNEFFEDNYTNDRVVTGWKIVNVGGVIDSDISTTGDNRYNYADRKSKGKDIGRVLAQGGYFNVPEGVTAITIEPYWGKAVYLSDSYYDVTYHSTSGKPFTPAGKTRDDYNGQVVHYSMNDVWGHLDDAESVYDNAIVLVGNYHSCNEVWSNGTKPFTIMSIDENRDNEPDYSLYFKSEVRKAINPVRFDFINQIGIGMAAKEDGTTTMYNIGIFGPKGWFEVTETALAIHTEFEYQVNNDKTPSPLILNGGIYEQFCSALWGSQLDKTTHIIVGGNCFFNCYSPGCQSGAAVATAFPPVSILGGEYKEFYLSGVQPDVTPFSSYNALCYGNGGRIETFAGAYQEQIDGDVIIKFDHMIVDKFYGGGINEKKSITGDINITINNSQVGLFCGGPKFGNMGIGKTVTTSAENTVFNQFYGGGYGGTSLYQVKNNDKNNQTVYNPSWFNNYLTDRGKYRPVTAGSNEKGILTNYHMEYFNYSGGDGNNARFYTQFASLSVAEVRDIHTTLKDCIIKEDLYGGGCLGKVTGEINTILNNCTVGGSVFAGGYSAAIPTCEVMPKTPPVFSVYNGNTGVYTPAVLPKPDIYTWAQATTPLTEYALEIDEGKKEIYTYVIDLSDLGTVRGNTSIVIMGASEIAGSVFGGGNASKVDGNTHVHIQGGTINGNVYGAGNKAEVTGTTDVVIGGGE